MSFDYRFSMLHPTPGSSSLLATARQPEPALSAQASAYRGRWGTPERPLPWDVPPRMPALAQPYSQHAPSTQALSTTRRQAHATAVLETLQQRARAWVWACSQALAPHGWGRAPIVGWDGVQQHVRVLRADEPQALEEWLQASPASQQALQQLAGDALRERDRQGRQAYAWVAQRLQGNASALTALERVQHLSAQAGFLLRIDPQELCPIAFGRVPERWL